MADLHMNHPAERLRMADHLRQQQGLSYREAYEMIDNGLVQEFQGEDTPLYPSLSSGKVGAIERA